MRARFGRQTGGVSFFAFQDIITGTSGFLIALALFLALNLDEKLSDDTDGHPYARRQEELRSMQAQIASLRRQVADWDRQPALDEATLRRLVGQLRTSIAEMDARPLPGLDQQADATGRDERLREEKKKLLSRLEAMNASIHKAELLSSGLVRDIPDLEKKVIDAQSSLQRRQQRNVITLVPERDGGRREPILVLVQSSSIRLQRPDGAPAAGGSVAEFSSYLRQASPATHYVVLYFKPSGARHFETLTTRARAEGFEIGYDVIPEDADIEFSNAAPGKGGRP